LDAVRSAKEALNCGVTLDAVGVCIDDAVAAMLELTGKRVTEEVTNQVFSRFCVGK
jgi:tRNA modification GTPase